MFDKSTLFMQNKPNFGISKMNITLDMTSKYDILEAGSGQKTNPIQTQFNPIQSQFAERPKRMPISNGTSTPKLIKKLKENAPNIFKQFANIPPIFTR